MEEQARYKNEPVPIMQVFYLTSQFFFQLQSFWKQDVVFKMYMLMKIVF